jgi:purine-binding chemotaxis protein CheW
MSATQLCTFWVDGLLLGLEITAVQEVLRAQPMTKVPLAPKVVRGLIHLRGEVVVALDMRVRLSRPPLTSAESMNVLVRGAEGGGISLVVDAIGDVITVAAEHSAPVPDTLPPELKQLVTHIYKLERQLLLAIDVQRITQTH